MIKNLTLTILCLLLSMNSLRAAEVFFQDIWNKRLVDGTYYIETQKDETLILTNLTLTLNDKNIDMVVNDLRIEGDVIFRSFPENSKPAKITSIGETGANGRTGAHGNAVSGGAGVQGGDGPQGTTGKNAGRISITVLGSVFGDGKLTLLSTGQNGGDAGNGGIGGRGGTGGKGKDASVKFLKCVSSARDGGRGGVGGTGGTGGTGGKGGVIIYSQSLDPFIFKASVAGGKAGKPGQGGPGGAGGSGGDDGSRYSVCTRNAKAGGVGSSGSVGSVGQKGADGEEGTIIVRKN